MPNSKALSPDSTAERTALWRALHLQADAPPHVFEDDIGLRLLAPPDSWRQRPDMDPVFTRTFRASMVARARFVEDLVLEQAAQGVAQYVILGAGLDSFAQRRPTSPAACACLKWTSPRRRNGSAGDWSSWVTACRNGCNWSRWTSRRRFRLARWPRRVLDATRRHSSRPRASACIDPGRDAGHVSTGGRAAPGSTLAMTFMLPVDRWRRGPARHRNGRRAPAPAGHRSSASMRRPRSWRWRGRRFRDVRHVAPPYSRSGTSRANGWLELVERRRILIAGT